MTILDGLFHLCFTKSTRTEVKLDIIIYYFRNFINLYIYICIILEMSLIYLFIYKFFKTSSSIFPNHGVQVKDAKQKLIIEW